MIQVYKGDGKGKTTAAIGLIIRAFGHGRKPAMVLFDKGSINYKHSELIIFDRLGIHYHITGCERMKPDGTFRFGVTEADKREAKLGIEYAKDIIKNKKYDLIVLDEILSAESYGLLSTEDILGLLELYDGKIELVLTGRTDNQMILDKADLVTTMKKTKHYFDEGQEARPGIEY
ncbi:MAG: cob(I)yrinic acid a,c-diamide adenosyltransferase [Candidatus Riflebacteria bacterium]|mgnify:CR=1 FL=1|nr:cob(I)yrinic acid a,c-diamide adenosyltransferase [Candidatus Riflebacteria bacterium]